MNKTKIEWCDYTWNPIVGCSPASTGCANCYAEAISRRFGIPWGHPQFMPKRIPEPGRVKKGARIFVCSMSDLGHPGVKPEWLDEIAAMMSACPQHTFMVLTKRPGAWLKKFAQFAWCGVTVENQDAAENRIPILNAYVGTQRRFISIEPMLGPVRLDFGIDDLRVDWVIAGPETGPKARSCEPWWIEEAAWDCEFYGIPFFDKRGILRREFPNEQGEGRNAMEWQYER